MTRTSIIGKVRRLKSIMAIVNLPLLELKQACKMLAPPWPVHILHEYQLRPLQDMFDKAAFEAFSRHHD
jgi:hypothetical protein